MLNPTQLAGLVFIAIAGIACLMARPRGPWRALAAVYGLLFVDMIFGLRHHLHDWVNAGLIADGLYQQRSGGQMMLLALLGIGAVALLFLLFRPMRLPARIGLFSTAGMVLLLLIEMVSLHRVDAMLYQPVGPLFLIAFLWIGLCLTTASAALLDKGAQRRGGKRRSRSLNRPRQQRR